MRIVKPSYFQCPNDLVDQWMPLLKGNELRILLIVIRKTFGWHKEKDYISISLFQELSGMSQQGTSSAVNSLVEKGILKKEITGIFGKEQAWYSLIVNEQNEENDPPKNLGGDPPKNLGGTSLKIRDTKDNTKDNVCIVCKADPCQGNCKKENSLENHGSSFLERKDHKGIPYIASIQDVFGFAVKTRKNWTSNEIQEAWKIFENYTDAVNNYLNFIEGVINNIRQKQKNNFRNSQKQGKKRENTYSKPSNNMLADKTPSISKEQETITKEELRAKLAKLGLTIS